MLATLIRVGEKRGIEGKTILSFFYEKRRSSVHSDLTGVREGATSLLLSSELKVSFGV